MLAGADLGSGYDARARAGAEQSTYHYKLWIHFVVTKGYGCKRQVWCRSIALYTLPFCIILQSWLL